MRGVADFKAAMQLAADKSTDGVEGTKLAHDAQCGRHGGGFVVVADL